VLTVVAPAAPAVTENSDGFGSSDAPTDCQKSPEDPGLLLELRQMLSQLVQLEIEPVPVGP
jgi:hypothetical protein